MRLHHLALNPITIMRVSRPLFVIAFLCLAFGASELSAQNLGASVRVGTGGIGVGLTTRIVPTLNGRVDVSYFSYSFNGEEELDETLVEYNGEGDLFFVSALADWHPFNNAFRLSGGAMYNGLEGRGGAVPVEDIGVGRNSYSPDEVGELNVDVSFGSKFAPYLGLGYGNAVSRKVGFLLDVGVIYAGSPEVDVNASGMLTPTESEAAQIEQNLEWVQWYPIVSLGFNVRLN